MMNTSSAIQDEEIEEVVSLNNSPTAQPIPKFSSEPLEPTEELFEFFSGSKNNLPQKTMSHAEDIIFCGKLIPLKQQESRDNRKNCDCRVDVAREEEERDREGSSHRRRQSPKLKYATQPNSPKRFMMRNSKSLDYEQLRRNLSSDCRSARIRRYSSTRSSDRYDTSGQKVNKPRWYSMLFGLLSKTLPETMELRDMKSRLVRRTPSTMFSQSDRGQLCLADQSQRKSSWGLLSVLSCKNDTSVGVATSFGCMPQVNSCDDIYSRATCT